MPFGVDEKKRGLKDTKKAWKRRLSVPRVEALAFAYQS